VTICQIDSTFAGRVKDESAQQSVEPKGVRISAAVTTLKMSTVPEPARGYQEYFKKTVESPSGHSVNCPHLHPYAYSCPTMNCTI